MYEAVVYKNEDSENKIIGKMYLKVDDKFLFKYINVVKSDNKSGISLHMPSYKNDEEYREYFHPISSEFYGMLVDAAKKSIMYGGEPQYIYVHDGQKEAYSHYEICNEAGKCKDKNIKSLVRYVRRDGIYEKKEDVSSYELMKAYCKFKGLTFTDTQHEMKFKEKKGILTFGNEFICDELQIRTGKNGDFIAMPTYRKKYGTFVSYCQPVSKEFAGEIKEMLKYGMSEEIRNLKSDESCETIVINAFGGPGAGKTTACLDICAALKKAGYNAEYVQEYPKELIYENRTDLLDGSRENQLAILNEQNNRIERLIGKVDFVVTDSPILLNGIYLKESEKSPSYDKMLLDMHNKYNNFSFFLQRDGNFVQDGRIHNLEESKQLDGKIKAMLKQNDVFYCEYSRDNVNLVVKNAQTTLKRIKKQNPMNKALQK